MRLEMYDTLNPLPVMRSHIHHLVSSKHPSWFSESEADFMELDYSCCRFVLTRLVFFRKTQMTNPA
jgi:hypothetical protein